MTLTLLREAMADDDCRHFLLHIAAGEYRKDPLTRMEWVIGGRYVTSAEWSADSRFVTLMTAEEFGGGEEKVEVAKQVAGAPAE